MLPAAATKRPLTSQAAASPPVEHDRPVDALASEAPVVPGQHHERQGEQQGNHGPVLCEGHRCGRPHGAQGDDGELLDPRAHPTGRPCFRPSRSPSTEPTAPSAPGTTTHSPPTRLSPPPQPSWTGRACPALDQPQHTRCGPTGAPPPTPDRPTAVPAPTSPISSASSPLRYSPLFQQACSSSLRHELGGFVADV